MSRCLLALLPILPFVTSGPVNAQDQLRWNLRSGDQLQYNIIQKMESATKIGEETVRSNFEQTIDMSWKVMSGAANGDAVLTQVFDRVRLKMDGQGAGPVEFDTAAKTPADNPLARTLADVFGNIVDQPFQVKMKATGDIADVQIPNKLMTAISQSAAGRQGAIDRNMVTDMMKQSVVMLPAKSVGPGSKWETVQKVQMPFGTMTITSAMQYVQKDANGDAIIDFVPTVQIEPREGIASKMTLNGSRGRGRVIFDIAGGRVRKTILDLTLQMTVEINGQKLPQTVRNQTAMTLIPAGRS